MIYLFTIGSLKVGGAERSVSRLVNHLAGMGSEVHLVLRKDEISFPLHPDVRVHILSGWNKGGKVRKIVQLRNALRRCIKEIDPDVSVGYTSLYSVILAATLVRNVVIRFDVYPLTLKKWKRSLFFTFLNLPNVQRIVCITSDTKTDLAPYFPKKQLEIIHNAALPEEAVVSQNEFSWPRRYFVGMARLVRTKGFQLTIQAFADSKAYRTHDFIILGDGGYRDRLQALCHKLGVEEYVHFLGYQKSPFPIIAGADFFVHASYREGFPNVLTEALSHGVPVIATDCKTGPSEIIQEGRNGYLIPVGDVAGLADKIELLCNNQVRLGQLSSYAKSSVSRFSEDIVFSRWEDMLSSV
jgi:N-acetylgalactosamine-N,N'-diacetylbacillosaminyl-diphospho-undecaprenol 4-alpha-N-acetylgalactosaminyltransferase